MRDDGLEWLATKLAGTYRIVRELGRGGWGIVYLAEDLRHQRSVALKVLHSDTAGHMARERFLREIAVGARLVHPHIVALFDSGDVDGLPYCVMPFVEGETLQQRLRRETQLPIADALRIARQVADALAYAHAHGVVHRDVKPANILLANGNAMVADFGIARAIDISITDVARTTAGVQLGTPAYMSPEQAAGDPLVDGRTDQYSLACMLYEMLAGNPPFEAASPAGLLARHALDPVPPLRTVRRSVTPTLENVILRALEKAPADRYPNAGAFRDALDAAATEEPWSGPHPLPFHERRSMRRAMLVAVVGIAAVGATAAWLSRTRAEARAVAQADTSRILLVPFEGERSAAVGAEEAVRRAIARWSGVGVVDNFVQAGMTATTPLTLSASRALALRAHTGRFVRGVMAGAAELRVILHDVHGPGTVLREANVRLPRDPGARDSAIARLVEELLVRQPLPRGDVGVVNTRSLPARQAYLRGRTAVERWDLPTAERALDSAWAFDPRYGDAALWLALVRDWQDKPMTTWRLAADAAHADSARLGARGHGMAAALLAASDGQVADACDLWDALARQSVFDFAPVYGSALCHDRDHLVLPDARSPSGWRFRSSYQAALTAYLRAFRALPAMHRTLSDQSFERLRMLLQVAGQWNRSGTSLDGRMFVGSMSIDQDTLVFVPYPIEDVQRAQPALARARTDAAMRAVRRQRERFRDVAQMWVSADPESATAQEALALSLQLLGDASAIDTLRVAAARARSDEDRLRLAYARVWIPLKFAVPDDPQLLRAVRMLADSLLRVTPPDERGTAQAGLAALLGRVSLVRRLSAGNREAVSRDLNPEAARLAVQLQLLSAFGAPADTIRMLERRVRSAIETFELTDVQPARRAAAFARAVRLGWPEVSLSAVASESWPNDYLIPGIAALDRQDTVTVRAAVNRLRALRETYAPATTTLDGLRPEAALLAHAGLPDIAAVWLDAALGALPTSSPRVDAVTMASLVRSMILRADLAWQLGDRESARRWAGAVVELWANAEAPLQPVVRRMRGMLTKQ